MVTYGDEVTRQVVEHWTSVRGFAAKDQLCLHFRETPFEVVAVHVTHADDCGDVLTLKLIADGWQGEREFGLSADGSLFW